MSDTSLDVLRPALTAEQVKAQKVCAIVLATKIANDSDLQQVTDWTKEVKARLRELDAQERSVTDPIKTALEAAKALFRPTVQAYKSIEAAAKTVIGQYYTEVEAIRQASLEAARDAVAEDPTTAQAALVAIPDKPAAQGMSVRMLDALVIERPDDVPREYCSPDPAKCKAALQAGLAVPGCRLEKKVSTTIRA